MLVPHSTDPDCASLHPGYKTPTSTTIARPPTEKPMRHRFRRLLVLLGAAMTALAGPARATDLTPFKIGISAPVVTIFPVWMAEAGGFYEKEGLKVEVVNMEGGTRGLQVLLSGEIQGMHVGLAPAVLANKQGADLRLVTSTCNTIPITMFTKAEVGMADLKGKTFGISTFGSETDIAIGILLKQLGLTRQDVTVSQIGGSSQRFAALLAGRIDVAPLIEPAITRARERGFHALVDLAAAGTPWIFDSVVVTTSYLKQNRATLTRFVRAYVAGAYLALSDESKAKAVIAQKFKTNDAKVIDATYADFRRLMPRDAAPTIEGARNVLDQLVAIGTDVGSRNVDDYLDLGIIGELKHAGYFDQMAKTYPVSRP
jgi:NitT/TauT family transport system substrate-binding protein